MRRVLDVLLQGGQETIFKVKRHTKMKKVFAAYASRRGIRVESLRFVLDGDRISPDDTPESVRITFCRRRVVLAAHAAHAHMCANVPFPRCAQLELEDDDQIDAVLFQEGGASCA